MNSAVDELAGPLAAARRGWMKTREGTAAMTIRPLHPPGRLLMALCLTTAAPAWATDEMYLQLAGVPGDSLVAVYANWIVLQSFSLSGTSTNKCAGITVVHYVDKATPPLIKLALTAGTVASGTLAVRQAASNPFEYYKVTMTGITVSSVQDAGAVSSGSRTLENVTLKPQAYVVSYVSQSANGTLNAPVTVTVDCAGNTVQ
jgi:type VI secretion system secreted protein Hcp